EAESYDCRCPRGYQIGYGSARCESASRSRSVRGEPSDSPCICSGAKLCESGRNPSIRRRNSVRAEHASETAFTGWWSLASRCHLGKAREDCAFPGGKRKSPGLLRIGSADL